MTYEVQAYNTATASTNKIHDDAVARQFGFAGGLVPGVDVYAYMTHSVVARYGLEFLTRGRMHARFHKPVYDGDRVTVEANGDEPITLTLRDSGGDVCATGDASVIQGDEPPNVDAYPRTRLPDPPPPASAEVLRDAWLGTVDTTFDAAKAVEYLAAIREPLALDRVERVAHPGWLLRRANRILARNVTLGPWIHVESAVRHFGLVHDGERVSTFGRTVDVFERGGHEFVALDVLVVAADTRPVMHIAHTAIFSPKARPA